jgi:hypothetical protein
MPVLFIFTLDYAIKTESVEKQFYDLYRSPNIIRDIISRRVRWAGHVARVGWDRKRAYRVWVGRYKGKNHLEITS